MNVLVTGATGFIGSHLLQPLSQEHRVFALTRSLKQSAENRIVWIQSDLTSAAGKVDVTEKVDAVVYLAQAREYRDFPNNVWPIFDVNVKAMLALLEYARQANVKKFVFLSSANVYKWNRYRLSEDAPLEPNSFYARSKYMAEMLLESYAMFFNCIVLRLFTVYGPAQKGMIVQALVERVRQGRAIEVQGKHGLLLSPIYVSDVCSVIHAVLESHKPREGFHVFNVGGDETVDLCQLGHMIGSILNITPLFEFRSGNEPQGWIADNTKLKKTFNVGSFVPIDQGIRQVIYG